MTTVLAEGSLFANRYRVIGCIALGGMGAVYEVVHAETGRGCALKALLPSLIKSDAARERFLHEARLAAQVRSDHVVDVLDAGVDGETGIPFIVMELLRGEDLEQRLARLGRFSCSEVVRCLHQAALGLDRIHAASIVHRDLKPENLFLSERDDGSPRVKVLDFGIALLLREGKTAPQTAGVAGTPQYMAPEQFRPTDGLTLATDVYALGMIAYTLLVGSDYWAEERAAAPTVFMFATVCGNGAVEPATARASRAGVNLPLELDAWFAKATASDSGERFASASEAVSALGRALDVAPSLGAPARDAAARSPSANEAVNALARALEVASALGRNAGDVPPERSLVAPRAPAVNAKAKEERLRIPGLRSRAPLVFALLAAGFVGIGWRRLAVSMPFGHRAESALRAAATAMAPRPEAALPPSPAPLPDDSALPVVGPGAASVPTGTPAAQRPARRQPLSPLDTGRRRAKEPTSDEWMYSRD